MKKLVLLAISAILCFSLTSCEKEIGCLYEVMCEDSSWDLSWKTLGYTEIRTALENVGFIQETTDVFSKQGTPTNTTKLIKETVENTVSNSSHVLLGGCVIKVTYMNDKSLVTTVTYPGGE